MSGPERDKPDDSLLEEFLHGRSEVSHAYHAVAKEVPPAELDNVVLDRVQREAVRVPAPALVPRVPLWQRARWPLSAAALFVLSFNVFFAIRQDREARQATLLEPAVGQSTSGAPEIEVAATAAGANARVAEEVPKLAEPEQSAARPSDTREGESANRAAPSRADALVAMPQSPGFAPDPVTKSMADAAPEQSASPPPAAFPEGEFASQALERMAPEKREQELSMQTRSRMEADQSRAARGAEQAKASSVNAGGRVEAFLERPGVRRLPPPAVALDQPRQVLRQGTRRPDGSCDFPAPPADPATPAGASLVELQLVVDPATCEALMERGYLRRPGPVR